MYIVFSIDEGNNGGIKYTLHEDVGSAAREHHSHRWSYEISEFIKIMEGISYYQETQVAVNSDYTYITLNINSEKALKLIEKDERINSIVREVKRRNKINYILESGD